MFFVACYFRVASKEIPDFPQFFRSICVGNLIHEDGHGSWGIVLLSKEAFSASVIWQEPTACWDSIVYLGDQSFTVGTSLSLWRESMAFPVFSLPNHFPGWLCCVRKGLGCREPEFILSFWLSWEGFPGRVQPVCLGDTCSHQKGGDNSQVPSDSSGPRLTGCSQGKSFKMPLSNPLKASSHVVGSRCELRAVSIHHQMGSISVF